MPYKGPEQGMASFGGAWSNHLLALAALGNTLKFPTLGIVRGEEPRQWNPVLKELQHLGMRLHFVSRAAYRNKQYAPEISALIRDAGNFLIVPEGGSGKPGIKGASQMVNANEPYDRVVLPGGTGATATGIAETLLPSGTKVLVFQVLKGEGILRNEVLRHSNIDLNAYENLVVNDGFHFGGYARIPEELRVFEKEWQEESGIKLDPIYGLKAMAGLRATAESGFFKPGSRLLYVHTGGCPELTLSPNEGL